MRFLPIIFSLIMLSSCASFGTHGLRTANTTEILQVSGITTYNEHNINETREDAIYDAKIKAVRRIAELFSDATYKIDGKTEILENLVNSDVDLFIHKYKIKSEGQDRDKYIANLSLYIYTNKVAASVKNAGLVSSLSGPKAGLYVEENPANSGFAKAFTEALSKYSIMTVVPFPSEKIKDASYDSLNSAAAELGAEIFIKAKASAYTVGNALTKEFFPSVADGSVEVIQSPSQKRLSDISRQGSGNDTNKNSALRQAMAALAEKLAKDTAMRVDVQIKSDPVVKLVFTGLNSFEQLETIKADLLKMNFKYLSLDSYSDGKAVFSVATSVKDTQEIASIVLRGESLGVQLGTVSGKEISFIVY